MKIDPRQVRFLMPLPTLGPKRIEFVGRGNTIQLLETAVVIEGYLRLLWMPVVDRFFQRVLSEWTTVTIPYSRILNYRYTRLLTPRILATALIWVLPLLPLFPLLGSARHPNTVLMLVHAGQLGLLALILTLYVNLLLLAPRNYLLYRQADGRPVLTTFRIRSRKSQAAFQMLLESNRKAAAGLAGAAQGGEDYDPTLPFGLLVLYLLYLGLVEPIWRTVATAYRPASPLARMESSDNVMATVPLSVAQFLHTEGPVLLLALLLWRWNEIVRWVAVFLLALHGLVAILGPGYWELLGVPSPYGPPLDLSPANLVSLAFHLILAVLLAARRAPQATAGDRPTP